MEEFFVSIILFVLGLMAIRLLVILIFVAYNLYRVNSKFNKLYKSAKDDRMRRDLYIDFYKMDKVIPINIFDLAVTITKKIECDSLLSDDLYYFLYEY